MTSTSTEHHTIVVDTGRSDSVWAVAFHPDGMHFLSGSGDGIRQWRVADGQQVLNHTGMNLNAVAVSRDYKWIVCGAQRGASVWDAELQAKVVEVEHRSVVAAIDISPDSSRFATGTDQVSVWSITTGQRLVGPLEHDNDVRGVKFSPDGKHIATASEHDAIRVFDSYNGDQLITIDTIIPSFYPITPLAWSNDGKHIFATSADKKLKSFDVSTGSQLAESRTLDGTVESIALAGNGKFIATFASHSISFLDTSTLTEICPAIEDSEDVRSIALSPQTSHLVTGQCKGKIAVRNLGSILPDPYGPFHATARHDQQHDEHASTSGGPDDRPPVPSPEDPRLDSETRSEDGDDDLLNFELPSSTPKPLFNYDEPPSPVSSIHHGENHVSPLGPIPQPLDALPEISPPGVCSSDGDPDNIKDASALRRWLRTLKRHPTDPTPHTDNPPSSESRRPGLWFRSRSPANVNATHERFSIMAEGRRQPRSVAKSIERPRKPPPKGAVLNHNKARRRQRPADPMEAISVQDVNDISEPLVTISVTHQPESGKAVVSLALPAWVLCFRSGAEEGTH
ncbi:WD40-repeat-containing domain protein [Boletus edulis]|nr:WD40-repeat-containing domain protein [Boletus edulis]